jgi:hypothetical protein
MVLTGHPFRKAYLESLIDDIEVDNDQIRIKGDRDVLEQAVPLPNETSMPRVRRRVPRGAEEIRIPAV